MTICAIGRRRTWHHARLLTMFLCISLRPITLILQPAALSANPRGLVLTQRFQRLRGAAMAAMGAQGTATRAMGRRGRENDGAQGSVGEPYCSIYYSNAFHDYSRAPHCPQGPSPRGSPSRLEGRIARPSASRTELVCLQEVYSDMTEAASSTICTWGRYT